MRWLTLYARARQVPLAFAALVVATLGIRLLSRSAWSLLPAALALTAGVAVAATGLSGHDLDLDRTAAVRWPVRRLVHLLLSGMVAGGAVLAVQLPATSGVAVGLVVRDTAGLLGLAGLAATVLGGQYGWTLPVGWFAVAPFVPSGVPGTLSLRAQLAAWMLQPTGSTAATWTAAALAAGGIATYTVLGARR